MEIEQAMGIKLEGFIAMKTRLMHNRVNKWAEQVMSKVESIVEWIKTGGKQSRSIRKSSKIK